MPRCCPSDAGSKGPGGCWLLSSQTPFGRQIMERIALAASLVLSLLALGACGTSTSDRAISGGGIGAGAGAIGGWMLGAPVTGALLGGAVGAGAGALTKPDQINLGKPVWK
jgi:osmotically inducible lipoprotein OsmB